MLKRVIQAFGVNRVCWGVVMRSPEDEGAGDSDRAAERLRQHLESRLPAQEVEEILEDLQLNSPETAAPSDEEPSAPADSSERDSEP